MRMRKKKHLEERLEACAPVMLTMQNQNEHANDPLDDDLFFEVGSMELEKPADSEQPQA